jgi:hypothetical protein
MASREWRTNGRVKAKASSAEEGAGGWHFEKDKEEELGISETSGRERNWDCLVACGQSCRRARSEPSIAH